MYVPKDFGNNDIEDIERFLNQNSFGILVSQSNGKLLGTHIPMMLERGEHGERILCGHVSKANNQGKLFNSKDEVLAIHIGPHAYISSSWYGHENVPTWNYIAVHIYGILQIIHGERLLLSLKKLIDKYECHSSKPISIEKFSPATLSQVQGITGFEIKITEIQAAFKLSQNRNDHDYESIIQNLKLSDDPGAAQIAEAMRIRRESNRKV